MQSSLLIQLDELVPAAIATMTGSRPAEPFRRFYAIRDKDSPAVNRVQRSQQGFAWDPWPVKECKGDATFDAAKKLVHQRNLQCVNICADKIMLLPASGNVAGVQGGSKKLGLNSLRSPDALPIRFHMWELPVVMKWHDKGGFWSVQRPKKIMVRHGHRSETLTSFLQSFGVAKEDAKECDLCDHFSCWKALKMTDKYLNDFPEHLRDRVYEKWWKINGFRFLELPPELREVILEFSITPIVEPFKNLYQRNNKLKGTYPVTGPNLNLNLVNKQIDQEMISVLFRKTSFLFRHAVKFEVSIKHLDTKIRKGLPTSLERLCSIELQLEPGQLLKLVDCYISRGNRRYHYEKSLAEPFPQLRTMCLKTPALKRLRIMFPHISTAGPGQIPNSCQKPFCLAFWAGARASLRQIPRVELDGYIDKAQKQEWLDELTLERRGIIPEQEDLIEWQKQIWYQWYVLFCCQCERYLTLCSTDMFFSSETDCVCETPCGLSM